MAEESLQDLPQSDAFREGSDLVNSIASLKVTDRESHESYGECSHIPYIFHWPEPFAPEISIYPGREVRVGRDSKW